MPKCEFKNPFRPGAGHMPPYLAGRNQETNEFRRLLSQETILQNLVLTGLRGVGKTVLLESFKPIAFSEGWHWVGTDLSEASSISEENIATRLLTDLSVVTSSVVIGTKIKQEMGFASPQTTVHETLNFQTLAKIYQQTPGLAADKLKMALEITWGSLVQEKSKGIIFAYDEAQNLSDHAVKDQFPLSLLLDVFQSIQRKNIPFMLILTGLPTLFPKLVEARTYTERMFHIMFLDRLGETDSRDAILKPITDTKCPVSFNKSSVDTIVKISGGYPYFIQFICREVYDVFIQKMTVDEKPAVPIEEIVRKLDADFFAGRWARATDRQRELLRVVATLENSDQEFTVQEIVERSKQESTKPFSGSHVNQMLSTLTDAGLVYKNRHGKYSFAVPLLGQFILRQLQQNNNKQQRLI